MKSTSETLIFLLSILFLFLSCDFFTDFESPKVRILSPKQDEIVYGNVDIVVEASDNKKIDRVELYLDGVLAKNFRQASFTFNWNLTESDKDTIHSVCAKAFDGRGNFDESHVEFWGFAEEPNAPKLLLPENNEKLYLIPPQLIWTKIPFAELYHLEVDDSPDFSSPFINDKMITDTSYVVTIDLPYKIYYWRVCAKQPVIGWGAWSTTSTFEVNFYKWKFRAGSDIEMSPAIGFDGTIYVVSFNASIYAINPDGTLKWKFQADDIIRASPAIGPDGTIYFGCTDKNIYAVNPDGSLKWKYLTTNQVTMSPAIGTDGTIYIGPEGSYLHALSPDGELKWTFRGQARCFSPVIGSDGTIYIAAGYFLNALNPDGSLNWKYNGIEEFITSPIIGLDGIIYSASHYHLFAIYSDGIFKCKYEISSNTKQILVGIDGLIVFNSYSFGVTAINQDGSREWGWRTAFLCCTIFIGSDGTIYCGMSDRDFQDINGGLIALDNSGHLRKDIFLGENIYSAPAMGEDGTIYVGTEDGNVYAIPGYSSGMADSPWPKFRHDSQNTGRAGN